MTIENAALVVNDNIVLAQEPVEGAEEANGPFELEEPIALAIHGLLPYEDELDGETVKEAQVSISFTTVKGDTYNSVVTMDENGALSAVAVNTPTLYGFMRDAATEFISNASKEQIG